MISNHADIMTKDFKGQTPMHLACIKGDLESFSLMAERCIQAKSVKDTSNKSPLDYAIQNNHFKIIEADKDFDKMVYSFYDERKVKVFPKDFETIMGLGSGAFGKVFLVKRNDSFYAMKVMKKKAFNGLMNLVLTEKEVQRKLKSRFVVQLSYAF